MPLRANSLLNQRTEAFKVAAGRRTPSSDSGRISRDQSAGIISTQPLRKPATMEHIRLGIGERGFIVGMTETGKSTLAETLIYDWVNEFRKGYVIIIDSKPRFRAEKELSGIPTSVSRRYEKWDYGPGPFPGSVVLPLRDIDGELRMAVSLGYRIIIAQVDDRFKDIGKLNNVIISGYNHRKKGKPLLFYVDETNNFFRHVNSKEGSGIVMVLTSGRERYVGALLAGQRPRHVSVEAMECMTKLYSFYFPFDEDVKHLKAMGIPAEWKRPTAPIDAHVFSLYDRKRNLYGMCHVQPVPWAAKKGKVKHG